MANEIYTRREIASLLGVTVNCVYKWEKAGKISPAGHVNGRPRYALREVQRLVCEKYPDLRNGQNNPA